MSALHHKEQFILFLKDFAGLKFHCMPEESKREKENNSDRNSQKSKVLENDIVERRMIHLMFRTVYMQTFPFEHVRGQVTTDNSRFRG